MENSTTNSDLHPRLVLGPVNISQAARLYAESRLSIPGAAGVMLATPWQNRQRIQLLVRNGPSWGVYRAGTGEQLAAGGFHEDLPGVGHGWTLVSERVRQLGLGLALVRLVRRQVAHTLAGGRFHRLQACCPSSCQPICRWLGALGFVEETRLTAAAARGADDLSVFAILKRKGDHGR